MSGKIGIDGIKAAMRILTTGTNIGFEAMADGSISLTDALLLMKLTQPIAALVPVAAQIPAEAEDLQPEELEELVTFGVSELGMVPEKVKGVISASLKFIKSGVELGFAIRDAAQPAAPTA